MNDHSHLLWPHAKPNQHAADSVQKRFEEDARTRNIETTKNAFVKRQHCPMQRSTVYTHSPFKALDPVSVDPRLFCFSPVMSGGRQSQQEGEANEA